MNSFNFVSKLIFLKILKLRNSHKYTVRHHLVAKAPMWRFFNLFFVSRWFIAMKHCQIIISHRHFYQAFRCNHITNQTHQVLFCLPNLYSEFCTASIGKIVIECERRLRSVLRWCLAFNFANGCELNDCSGDIDDFSDLKFVCNIIC